MAIAVHIPSAFKIGDSVRISSKITEANSWDEKWDGRMDRYVGQAGVVLRSDPTQGFQVRTSDGEQFWYPSPALQLLGRQAQALLTRPGAPRQTNAEMSLAPAASQTPKKKRVRVGKGPWDSAPCPHLRWHLMGFFREKLAFSPSKVTLKNSAGADVEVNIAEVDVTCTKCRVKMTLQAK